jgi:hypothetical protein
MYLYETGIPMIDREYGGLPAGPNVLILAPPLRDTTKTKFVTSPLDLTGMVIEVRTDDGRQSVERDFRVTGIHGRTTPWIRYFYDDGTLTVEG